MTDTQERALSRYLRLMILAHRRYSKNGMLVWSIGHTPASYQKIEIAAWSRFQKVDA